jgi:hypothetical protein
MDVDEKAKQNIDKQDGIILIFTQHMPLEGGMYTASGWLTGELSYAIGKNKSDAIFYENTIHPDHRKGIHGDYEYVEFNRNSLDEAFLQAIPYLQNFKEKLLA